MGYTYIMQIFFSKQTIPLLTILLVLLLQTYGFSHGEDKLGPHKGYIRMPGSYHTEVKQHGTSSFTIYLLDMHWKNPSTHQSEVTGYLMRSIRLKDGHNTDQKIPLMCTAHRTSFLCQTTQSIQTQPGDQLFLNTTRDGQKGGVVNYALPLSLAKKQDASTKHSGHTGH